MRVRVLSDLHLEFGPRDLPCVDCDVIVVAGDAGTKLRGVEWALSLPPETPVVYVLGNHEYYGSKIPNQLQKIRSAASGTHVHVLENQSLCLDGVTFLGTTLWTDFLLSGDRMRASVIALEALADFQKIRLAPRYSRLHPNDLVRLHSQAVAWLRREIREKSPSVVVTHHAPTPLCLDPSSRSDHLSAAFASDLDELIQSTAPALWIHGHTHRSVDFSVGPTRIVSNAAGYPGEASTGFDATKVVEISPTDPAT